MFQFNTLLADDVVLVVPSGAMMTQLEPVPGRPDCRLMVAWFENVWVGVRKVGAGS
jgi:hypothetical protein